MRMHCVVRKQYSIADKDNAMSYGVINSCFRETQLILRR